MRAIRCKSPEKKSFGLRCERWRPVVPMTNVHDNRACHDNREEPLMCHQSILDDRQPERDQRPARGRSALPGPAAPRGEAGGLRAPRRRREDDPGRYPDRGRRVSEAGRDLQSQEGPPARRLAPLAKLDPDQLAYVALSKTFKMVANAKPLSATTIAIGLRSMRSWRPG